MNGNIKVLLAAALLLGGAAARGDAVGLSVSHVLLAEMARQRGLSLQEAAQAAKTWGIDGVDLSAGREKDAGEALVAAGLWPVKGATKGWLAVTCPGSTNLWDGVRLSALALHAAHLDAVVAVDLAKRTGAVRPALHSASWRSPLSPDYGHPERSIWIRKLNLKAWRSHDAALVDAGQRVIDTHFIFPLMHLDAKNPDNYYFAATDNLIRKVREEDGLEVFYRLGSSIEHTSDRNAVNTQPPPDPVKYAEVLAGIVRHYNCGWANGYKWNIRYWELFNEPDITPCWRGSREQFITLFVTCLKRLKDEFGDAIKVGGPAFAGVLKPREREYVRQLLGACRKAGVKPDFFSWHHYGNDPDALVAQPETVRGLVAECGFPKMELIMNEWHYIKESDWSHGWRREPQMLFDLHDGPGGQGNVDSAAYALAVEAGFQDTCLAQSYYYGCGVSWPDWGYWDAYKRRLNKPYYAMAIMGRLVKDGAWKVASTSTQKGVKPFAALSADGRRLLVAIADYKSGAQEIAVDLKGAAGFTLAQASVVDYTRDLERFDATVAPTGRIVLKKRDNLSACFLLELAR